MTRSVGRLVCWAIELSEFDISFRPRTTIKGHTVANFIVENTEEAPQEEEASELYTDDSSAERGASACCVPIPSKGEPLAYGPILTQTPMNNKGEYETLINSLFIAKGAGVQIKPRGAFSETGKATPPFQPPMMPRLLPWTSSAVPIPPSSAASLSSLAPTNPCGEMPLHAPFGPVLELENLGFESRDLSTETSTLELVSWYFFLHQWHSPSRSLIFFSNAGIELAPCLPESTTEE